jgi:signal transduction histidine kinase
MAFSILKKLVPWVSLLSLIAISVILWKDENSDDDQLILAHTRTTAEQIKIRVEGLMNARISSLRLMADRWVERTPPDFSRKRFFQFADDIYTHYPGFAAINWIDASGESCWVFPEDKNAQARDRKPLTHSDPGYRRAFEKAGTGIGEVITPSVELFIGGIGFEVFLPLISDGELQGYLNGVFRINQIMDTCLAEKILDSFCIRLYEGDRLIYNNENRNDADNTNRLHVFGDIDFFGKTWRLDIGPKAGMYQSEMFRNWPVLIFGLIISMTIFLLINYLFRRMELYRYARNQAFEEIKERKKAEEALKKNEKTLESLLSELASKNEELETFVYTVSHDLKTPIITIEGFVGALREDFGNLLSADGNTYLNYISDATRKMGLLISDLLDLSRIGRLTENKAELQFGRLVEEVVAALQPMIREKGIKVTIQQDLPLAYGEEKRLRQAMENLLSNAVKYIRKDNPSPCINVGAKTVNNEKVFFVRDNGIGIEEVYFEKIFQVFQRLAPAKKIAEGTGMGLTIVKRIIEHHGGRIWVESEPGTGTTFFFTLKDKEA